MWTAATNKNLGSRRIEEIKDHEQEIMKIFYLGSLMQEHILSKTTLLIKPRRVLISAQ